VGRPGAAAAPWFGRPHRFQNRNQNRSSIQMRMIRRNRQDAEALN
jgi:hypothetical protein